MELFLGIQILLSRYSFSCWFSAWICRTMGKHTAGSTQIRIRTVTSCQIRITRERIHGHGPNAVATLLPNSSSMCFQIFAVKHFANRFSQLETRCLFEGQTPQWHTGTLGHCWHFAGWISKRGSTVRIAVRPRVPHLFIQGSKSSSDIFSFIIWLSIGRCVSACLFWTMVHTSWWRWLSDVAHALGRWYAVCGGRLVSKRPLRT